MYHAIELDHYRIEDKYLRNNRECLFDPAREILVIANPEEIVRQKILLYLQHKMGVPLDKIEVEIPMTHLKKGARGRADIIVHGLDEENVVRPVIVIECKAPNIPLTDDVYDQVVRYNEIIGANNLIITNGISLVFWSFDYEADEFRHLAQIPQYKELIEKQNLVFDTSEKIMWQRPAFSRHYDETLIAEYRDGWIGEDTPHALDSFLINLCGFIQDESSRLEPQILFGIKIIKDGGNRFTSFGNAAGGNWAGEYRFFIIEDKDGNNQIISMSLFSSLKCTNHPVFGNRKGTTTLVVAIDDFDKRHNSLQLNIDKFTSSQGNKYTLWHDGTITAGKTGACKRQDVIDYVRKSAPELLNNNDEIVLGSFDNSRAISWNQNTTRDFIGRLIKYALVRDQFRKHKQVNNADISADSGSAGDDVGLSGDRLENGIATTKKTTRSKKPKTNSADSYNGAESYAAKSSRNVGLIVKLAAGAISLVLAIMLFLR